VSKPASSVTVVERRQIIQRPPTEVFSFFDRPANLKRVFPSNLAVSLLQGPPDLRPGTLFRYRFSRWPLEFEWEAVVSDYRPPARFTKVKARGYFPQWAMEHEIVTLGPGSELRMRLSYEVPAGLYAALAHRYVVREAMEELVDAQILAIRSALETGN
jgi:ligand-binding SRPBCC domain-containing protein